MRLCVIQMDMRLGESAYNFAHAEALLRRAAGEGRGHRAAAGNLEHRLLPRRPSAGAERPRGGEAVKALCAPLARELSMNIVAGSVSDPARRARVQHRLRL